ncbi:MAG: DUF3037 domain-containing protein [Chitinophagaceae bacterium]|nr:DUF3037 domain-containing protein [Chitinophagaceae bacterium]
MQQQHLFEYAVIRFVPRVEREEFLNTGIVLYCKQQQFLKTRFSVNEDRILCLSPEADMQEIKDHFDAFQKIAGADLNGGPIARLDIASRFRWLTATRSTIIQSSKVHTGFCSDLELALEKLHKQLVE